MGANRLLRDQDRQVRQLRLRVTTDNFMRVIGQPETERLLDDLGIAVANPRDIFEVLDADASGSVDLNELTTGFMKLRGPADKGDAVASLLKMDTVLKAIRSVESRLSAVQSAGYASERSERENAAAASKIRTESDAEGTPRSE